MEPSTNPLHAAFRVSCAGYLWKYAGVNFKRRYCVLRCVASRAGLSAFALGPIPTCCAPWVCVVSQGAHDLILPLRGRTGSKRCAGVARSLSAVRLAACVCLPRAPPRPPPSPLLPPGVFLLAGKDLRRGGQVASRNGVSSLWNGASTVPPFSFSLTKGEVGYEFCCASQEELDRWVDAIERLAVTRRLPDAPLALPPMPGHPSPPPPPPGPPHADADPYRHTGAYGAPPAPGHGPDPYFSSRSGPGAEHAPPSSRVCTTCGHTSPPGVWACVQCGTAFA